MKLILRRLFKRKTYTIINILGLSLGIMCTIILFLMIQYNSGFDNYHIKKDRIYRVVSYSTINGNPEHNPGVPIPMINTFEEEFPEAEIVAPAVSYGGRRVVTADGTMDGYENVHFCDSRLYRILDRTFIKGSNEFAFDGPNKVVLSKSVAEILFNSTDIIGERLTIDGIGDVEVSGVMEDFPEDRTDFPFDILVSYETYLNINEDLENWFSTSSDFQCYFLLKEGIEISQLEARLSEFADKYYGEDRDDRINQLQPLSDLHYNPNYSNFSYHTVSKAEILVMVILGVFLLVTACINFINLATAQAIERFKEIGIRKVLGNSKGKIIASVLKETSLITLVSILIAVGMSELAILRVNKFLEANLSISYLDPTFILFVIGMFLFVSFLSGIYPAVIIAKYQPANILKSSNRSSGTPALLRKGLVVFQFAISQVLIIGTIITNSQLEYFQNLSIGFEKEGIINIGMPEPDNNKKITFQNALLQTSGIDNVTLAYGPPAWGGISITNFEYDHQGNREELEAEIKPADMNYIDVFDIELIAGSNLPQSDTTSKLLLNETFVKTMGVREPHQVVGEMISLGGQDFEVAGVVKDFHTKSFKRPMDPVAIFSGLDSYQRASIKVSSSNISNVIEDIEKIYSSVYPDYDFDYEFMDETFAQFYEGEQKMSEMLVVFSGISIFIGCLGLFGLVSYMANRKVKEIGIRKALGASTRSILMIFSREFTVLIIIAFVIAAPLAFYGMNLWLQEFVFRVELNPFMFLAGIGLTLLIASITISYKSISASRANPVDALRDE